MFHPPPHHPPNHVMGHVHNVAHVRHSSQIHGPVRFAFPHPTHPDVVIIPPDDGIGSGTPVVIAYAEPARP